MSRNGSRCRALQYAAVLGEAVIPFTLASHARNFLTLSLHEFSGKSTCERKSQKVREGGKEPGTERVSEV